MRTTTTPAVTLVHRLLFRALLEIRAQGQETKNPLVFHLADLFHNVVLEMQQAAEGNASFEDVFKVLQDRAKEKGLERWLDHNLAALEPEGA